MIDHARKYNEVGLAVHPTKKDKTPALGETWNDGFPPEKFKDAVGLAVICGKISGNVECMDFDNHFGDAKIIFNKFMEAQEVKEIYKQHKLVIETTPGGGYHLLYKCATIGGNRKLASRMKMDAKPKPRPDGLIEIRGEGGYFCTEPTQGYKVIKNSLFDIPVISELQRALLIENALLFNECYPSVTVTEYEKGDRPGDLYNESYESIEEMKSLLTSEGWKDVGHNKWRRPGKSEGCSATLGQVAPNVFYVFSANAYPFEESKAYTPFQVLGLLKFKGDFSEAAKSLPKPEKVTLTTKKTIPESELDKILNGAKIDTSKKIEAPPTVLQIKEKGAMQWNYKRLFTLGNFSVILGKAKSKKTFFLTMVASSVLNKASHDKFSTTLHTLGKFGVIWFDTEQGEYDSWNTVKRIERMAGNLNGFKAFSLRQYSPIERCQIIEHAFKLWGNELAYCVIDGIADLANGINDEDEATRVATMFLKLTKVYNCHISTVIHQNKNDNFATGHLGSAIMKKAEIIISVNKNVTDKRMADVNCDMSRGIDFEPFSFEITHDGLPKISDSEPKEVHNYYEEKIADPIKPNEDFDFTPIPENKLPF